MATSENHNLADRLLRARLEAGDGDRPALLTDRGSWTYAEVDALATAYAALLRSAGASAGDRILMAMPDGPDYVGILFGILRMGGVAVMLNPHLPVPQIRYMFGYTGGRVALVHTSVAGAFREAAHGTLEAPRIMEVGTADFTEELASVRNVSLTPASSDDRDPAIWLFSGGTTGRPKAVIQTHGSFLNTTRLYGQGVLGLSADDVTLSVPKLFFGYATGSNLFFPFSVGAAAALFPERCTTDTLLDKIEAFRPTVLVNVPTMINHLLAHPGAGGRDLSSLRVATSAGEALPVELHQRWTETFGVPLLDGLGTAEMWHIFVSNRIDDIRPGTLGRVVPGFEVKVCDDEGRSLPAGEVGRMWVRGASLALGYHGHPDKTAEAFQDGWYVSGDMIRMDGDGYVTYCGRGDDMLKVSGKWLSPREVEDCLLAHPSVREVAVVGVTTEEGLVKPHAFVVPAEPGAAGADTADALQRWVKERLEPYKYPRQVVFLDDLPRTHLGKVDRGKLARSET